MSESRAGWYPDPAGDESRLRYWDGENWTDRYVDSPDAQRQESASTETMPAPPRYDNRTQGASTQDATLRLVAFVFCIISTVSTCWLIIPLAWMIPMSVCVWGIYKGTRPNTVAFGVCTVIFVSLVGGILLLVSKKDA